MRRGRAIRIGALASVGFALVGAVLTADVLRQRMDLGLAKLPASRPTFPASDVFEAGGVSLGMDGAAAYAENRDAWCTIRRTSVAGAVVSESVISGIFITDVAAESDGLFAVGTRRRHAEEKHAPFVWHIGSRGEILSIGLGAEGVWISPTALGIADGGPVIAALWHDAKVRTTHWKLSRHRGDGSAVWTAEFLEANWLFGVDVSEGGPLLVAGSCTVGGELVAKLGADGASVWRSCLGGEGSHLAGIRIGSDKAGAAYILGEFDGTVVLRDQVFRAVRRRTVLTKLSVDGGVLWSRSLGGSEPTSALAIAITPAGTVLAVTNKMVGTDCPGPPCAGRPQLWRVTGDGQLQSVRALSDRTVTRAAISTTGKPRIALTLDAAAGPSGIPGGSGNETNLVVMELEP